MGFSGLNRILQSSPRELKLDAAVIRDVHASLVKQALIESFCSFGDRAGVKIVAEGIESAAELDALRALGIKLGQGYHLGRPQPLEAIIPHLPPAPSPPQHPFPAAYQPGAIAPELAGVPPSDARPGRPPVVSSRGGWAQPDARFRGER